MVDTQIRLCVLLSSLGVFFLMTCQLAATEPSVAWSISTEHPPVVNYAPDSPEPVVFAAAEVKRYLKAILCNDLPEPPVAADEPRVVLGIDDSSGLSGEGYEFRVEQNTFRITGGGPLGVVFGAYAFLKEYGGCRFADLGPDGEYVPRKEKIAVNAARVRREPKLAYRGLQFSYGEDEELNRKRIDWMAKNGFNYVMYRPAPESYDSKGMVDVDPETKKPVWPPGRVFRYSKRWFDQELRPAIRSRGLKLDMNHHNLSYWVPPSRHFETHPEWYAEIDGERGKRFSQLSLCLTNDEPVAALIERVRAYLRANPEVKVVGVIPEDGVGMCQCAKCVAADPDPKEAFRKPDYTIENRSKSKRYHTLLNKVAAAIAEEFPDVTVGGAAYVDLLWPARDLKFEPNTTVWVALYWRDAARPVCADSPTPINRRFYGILQQWNQVFPGRLIVYEYYMGMGAQRTLPYPMSRIICKDWPHLKKAGVEGATIQCWTHNHSMYALNNLAFAAHGWSDDVDHNAVLDDYLLGAFGSAGAAVRPIFTRMCDAVDKMAEGDAILQPNGDNIRYFLVEVGRDTIHKAIEEAETEAANDRERRQVKKLAAAVTYWEMAADIFELRAQAGKLRKTDPKKAVKMLDKAVNELWLKMERYMDEAMPPGWIGVNAHGQWKRTIDRMKRDAEALRAL